MNLYARWVAAALIVGVGCSGSVRVISAVAGHGAFADRVLVPPVDRSAHIDVGPNVQVSAMRPSFMHGEMHVAADPLDAKKLIACSITGTSHNRDWPGWNEWDVLYYSNDEGLTWRPRAEGKYASDPTCEYTDRGTALFIANRLVNYRWNRWSAGVMNVYRSADGGERWVPTAHLSFVDSEIMTPPSIESGRSGVVWVGGSGFVKAPSPKKTKLDGGAFGFLSTDDGVTFAPPVTIKAAPPKTVMWYYSGGATSLANGTKIYSYLAIHFAPNDVGKGNTTLEIAQANVGAHAFSVPKAGPVIYSNYPAPWTESRMMLAADQTHGPFRNRVYAAWSDWRTGRAQIMLSYSDDVGATWATPRIITDDRTFGGGRFGPDDTQPMLAVNKNGAIGVAWYSRAESDDDLGWTIRFRASRDGGSTWMPSVSVSSAANSFHVPRDWSNYITSNSSEPDRTISIDAGMHASHTFTGGDYAGMEADAAGVFHPIWSDNRTGVSQVWTAQIRVPGSARRAAAGVFGTIVLPTDPQMPPPPSYKRKSGQKVGDIFAEVSDAAYDAATQTFSVTVRLQNVSWKTLHGPWTLRADSVESGNGDASVASADNGVRGPGATWAFSAAAGNVLRPLQFSQARRISVRVVNDRPFSVADFWIPVGSPLLLAGLHYSILPAKP